MAVRKGSSTGKEAPAAKNSVGAKLKKPAVTKAKKPAARKAPGKADPRFMDRLSEAIREELLSSERGVPKAESASRGRNAAAPTEAQATAPARGAAKAPVGRAAIEAAPAAVEGHAAPAKPAKLAKPVKPAAAKARRAALLKELKALLDELDEEGLDFLLEQAQVHRYNMEVERLNEAQERRRAGRPSASGSGASRPAPLRVERSEDGQTYHIVSNEHYKMFTAEEMLALVRIAHANADPTEGARGLYRWLARERSDALADLGFKGPGSPGLVDLAQLLKSSFAPPPKRG
jgi:hypothetical protein